MNKYILSILTFICTVCMMACTDDTWERESASNMVNLTLTLNLPGGTSTAETRVTGTNTNTPYLDPDTKEQRYIKDITLLVMQDDRVQFLPTNVTLDNNQGEAVRVITVTMQAAHDPVDVMVLVNPKENGIIQKTLEELKGKTKEEIHDALVFDYPTTGDKVSAWDLTKRSLPMWGMVEDLDISQPNVNGYCDLYRSVAKMAVQVDESCTTFTLKEVYLYYMEKQGYLMSKETPNEEVTIQYTAPDVPSASTQTGLEDAVKYDVTDNAIINRIYLPESNNQAPGDGKKQLKVVVGGIYSGEGLVESGALSYYRIDMSDNLANPYDIIRNHSYIYNIKTVDNPGTPSPDKALDHAVPALKVELEDWTEEYLRGVPDQYTLKTNKSVITLEDYMDKDTKYDFDVWTDYSGGWSIETTDGKIVDVNGNVVDWLDIVGTSGASNQTVTVKVNANKINTGLAKTANFYVKAGNIRKQITIIMPQPETANCYVVGDGEYEIIVSIKGNGTDGTVAEGGVDIVPTGDATITPHHLGIIWETKRGLIELQNYQTGAYVSGNTVSSGQMPTVPYNAATSTLRYSVKSNITDAYIAGAPGGNALVGAFNEKGEVIWSWHIWVCPEMYDSNTHQIKENAFLQHWNYTGYDVMDRNLGALSNKPIETQTGNQRGVAAMGLQYQWGRKDPFIGPAYSNDDFPKNDPTGLLDVVHYYEDWNVINYSGTGTQKSNAIDETITHPTKLIYWRDGRGATALVSMKDIGGFLWGTDGGLSQTGEKDLGTKTIYDPCPVGYRVPPVDAFMFRYAGYKGEVNGPYLDGNSWKEDNYVDRKNYKDINVDNNDATTAYNVRDNVIYIPHYVQYRNGTNLYVLGRDNKTQIYITNSGGRYQWGDYHTWVSCYSGAYVVDADYYGFYVNIAEMKEPKLMNQKKSSTATAGTEQYDVASEYGNTSNKVDYYYKPSSGQSLTWLPMTGAYDPTIGVTFKKADGSTVSIEQGSTITVNSFLWTNSSIDRTGGRAPAALSLHGAEVWPANNDNNVNGRHFHNLSDTYANVDRHYTSAVRCIRDTKKVDWGDINSLTSTVSVTAGGSTTITIKSVNSSWKLVDPGEPWLQVTPDKGNADKGMGTDITLKVKAGTVNGSTTTISFQIEGEATPRTCNVTVQ